MLTEGTSVQICLIICWCDWKVNHLGRKEIVCTCNMYSDQTKFFSIASPYSSKAQAVLLRPLSHLKGFVTTGVHQGVLLLLQHRHLCLSDHSHLHNGSFEPPKRNSSTRKRNTFRGYASSMTDISRFVFIRCVDQAHLLIPFYTSHSRTIPGFSPTQCFQQWSLTACHSIPLGWVNAHRLHMTKGYFTIAVNQYNYCWRWRSQHWQKMKCCRFLRASSSFMIVTAFTHIKNCV